jgi:outer membrane immunogenic protein
MKSMAIRCAALLGLVSLASAASAQNGGSWDGLFAGLNLGEASNKSCDNWSLNGAPINPAIAAAFNNRDCPNNSTFVGGLQFGENFQSDRLVFGLGAEYDGWSAKSHNQSFTHTGDVPPPGSYAFSGKLTPSGFGIIGARLGYAGDRWFPYISGGGVIAGGLHNTALSYTPAGTKVPIASFNGGRNFTSFGWATGGGVEIVLKGPWSIGAEYLHVNLGNGSSSTTSCTGSAAACAEFSAISFDSVHNSFSANIIRVGVNYWFGY